MMSAQHGANESVVPDIFHDRFGTKTGRKEGEALSLLSKFYLTLREAGLTAEYGSHVPIGPIVVNEEQPVEVSNEAKNAAETIDTTQMRPSACAQNGIFPAFHKWDKQA